MQFPASNLDAITDATARQIIAQLLNGIETRVAENAALRTAVQRLRDELARLQGGSRLG